MPLKPKADPAKSKTKNSKEILYQAHIHEPALEECLSTGKGLKVFRQQFGITDVTYCDWKREHVNFRRIHHKYLGVHASIAGTYFGEALEFHAEKELESERNSYNPAIHDKAVEKMLGDGDLAPHFCREFNISMQTMRHWTEKYSSFHTAYSRGVSAGMAVWIDKMNNNKQTQYPYWAAIMRHMFKFGYEPLIGCRSQLSSKDLLGLALDSLGAGRIQGRVFDQLVHAAEVKMKIEDVTELTQAVAELKEWQKTQQNLLPGTPALDKFSRLEK